ncbi:MazG nucleotide pyrophosphohydrolase domain-containing protein [Stygiolobus caldivivus]|uniref:Nucleotide pyrophosphohydrolase n=1 Tax=Stygiolobus caldivivus TaxID=2824673 RepID=A0A8D5ZE05_9CREN|nr:MazG nucleotide pyrophosphohydrolase domain-containing protein [Stygiolobus caldivivus]BCU69388.1 nucleotide pyrophosphohydrolase [Stygiolobus caldivivus]
MEVKYVQSKMRELYLEKDKQRGLFGTFTWLVEEVGELAEALLSGDKTAAEEELADVIAWSFSIANLVGIDVEEALRKKYNI